MHLQVPVELNENTLMSVLNAELLGPAARREFASLPVIMCNYSGNMFLFMRNYLPKHLKDMLIFKL